ncbi:MAG: hypothetical protein AB1458_00715 [Bacteroidota bacterium]
MKKAKGKRRASPVRKDSAASYDRFKRHEGKFYTGMKVGRRHKWYYGQGEWKERKVTPDKWEITYNVTKRRAGKAPEGSGVPVGTEYHWLIIANQNVKKLNANDYSTAMSGYKYKVAHKRAGSEKWSASERAQRKRTIQLLGELAEQLKHELMVDEEVRKAVKKKAPPAKKAGTMFLAMEFPPKEKYRSRPVPIEIEYQGRMYRGQGIPVRGSCKEGVCFELDITLNNEHLGVIHCTDKGWTMKHVKDQGLVNAIGEEIFLWYE